MKTMTEKREMKGKRVEFATCSGSSIHQLLITARPSGSIWYCLLSNVERWTLKFCATCKIERIGPIVFLQQKTRYSGTTYLLFQLTSDLEVP